MAKIAESRKLKKAGVTTEFFFSPLTPSRPSLLCYLPDDSPIRIPWEKLSPPWDSSCHSLQALLIPLPPPSLNLPKEAYESLINRVVKARHKALQIWVSIHHVIALGPGQGNYEPPMDDGQMQGELFYRFLTLCQGTFPRIPKQEYTCTTAATWWVACIIEWWSTQVSQEMRRPGQQRGCATEVQKDFYRVSKLLQQIPEQKASALEIIQSPTLIQSHALLKAGGFIAGRDNQFKQEYWDPLVAAWQTVADEIPKTNKTFIDKEGKRRVINGRGGWGVHLPYPDDTREGTAKILKPFYDSA